MQNNKIDSYKHEKLDYKEQNKEKSNKLLKEFNNPITIILIYMKYGQQITDFCFVVRAFMVHASQKTLEHIYVPNQY